MNRSWASLIVVCAGLWLCGCSSKPAAEPQPRSIAVGNTLAAARAQLEAAGATEFDVGALARLGAEGGEEVGYELADGRTVILLVANEKLKRIEVCTNPDAPKSERNVDTPTELEF